VYGGLNIKIIEHYTKIISVNNSDICYVDF